MIKIEGDRDVLYQWDLNQRIVLTNIKTEVQIHFSDSNNLEECCPVVFSYEENGNVYADIPNKFLQKSGIIDVYIYVHEENKAYTEHRAEILVLSRKKPADYVYTETEVFSYMNFEKRVTQRLEQSEKINEAFTARSESAAKISEDAKLISSEKAEIAVEAAGRAESASNIAVTSANTANDAMEVTVAAKDISVTAANKAESASNSAITSAESAEVSAERAEQAAATHGYVFFEIDNKGHLIMTKTENINGLDFRLNNGRLEVLYG